MRARQEQNIQSECKHVLKVIWNLEQQRGTCGVCAIMKIGVWVIVLHLSSDEVNGLSNCHWAGEAVRGRPASFMS